MSDTSLRLFISHVSANKMLASELAARLKNYNMLPFVAHEDIEPSKSWQDEIEESLKSAHCMLALLNAGYSGSVWCNQEVGFCLARGIPIISVRIEEDPKGFLGKWQAYLPKKRPFDSLWEARKIFELILGKAKEHLPIRSWVVHCFPLSGSFDETNRLCTALQGISLSNEEIEIIRTAFINNPQVYDANNIEIVLGEAWVKAQRAAKEVAWRH